MHNILTLSDKGDNLVDYMKKAIMIILLITLIINNISCHENDYFMDISIDILPLSIYSALDISLEVYITPSMSINNTLMFYHNSIPSLMRFYLSYDHDMCNNWCCYILPFTTIILFTCYDPGQLNLFHYTKDFTLSYFLTYQYYFNYNKGFYIGGGGGVNFHYYHITPVYSFEPDDISHFRYSFYITTQIGYKAILYSNLSIIHKLQLDIPVCRIPPNPYIVTGLFQNIFILYSLHIGFVY